MSKIVKSLCEEAKKLGASEALSISAAEVIVDDRTFLKCQVPLCAHYGIDLTCPPNTVPVSQFRHIIESYHDAILIKVDIPMNELPDSKMAESSPMKLEYIDSAKKARLKLHEIVCRLESQCLEKGAFFAAGFIGGACPLCEQCVGVKSGLPCRHPFKARPAMEAMGIDVMGTVEKAGLRLSFGKDAGRSWVGLLLVS